MTAQVQDRTDSPLPTGILLARLGESARLRHWEILKAAGLKPPHVGALYALRADPVSQQTLSETTGIDAVKLVGVLNDLESAGLIERRRDAGDRRRHIVDITALGRERLAAVERANGAVDEELFAGLSAAEHGDLRALLQRVMATSSLAASCPEAAAAATCPDAAAEADSADAAPASACGTEC